MTTNGWQSNVRNVFKWVADTSILGETCVVVVNSARSVLVWEVLCVFNQSSKLNGIINVWFLFTGKAVTFSVASSFNVKHIVIGPNMLVISNKRPFGVTGQSCLTCARKTKQDSSVAIGTNIC